MPTSARLTAIALAAIGGVVLGACSSAKHPQTASPSSAGSVAAAAVTGQQPASSGSAPGAGSGTDLAAKGCTAIKIADVQPLVAAAVTKVEFDPGAAALDPTHSFQCNVNNPTMLIKVHPEDTSEQVYDQDVVAENVPGVPLPGIGDVAVWTAVSLTAGTYTSAPSLFAHKGSMTCEISDSGEGLTIPIEPGVAASITQANESAFAAKLGILCNDVFAALA